MTIVLRRYPLTSFAFATAVGLATWSMLTIFSGSRYIGALAGTDATTPLMTAALLFRGIYSLRAAPDLKIFAVSLIVALSFLYTFEAIYKFLFFGWRWAPGELRELLLQVATSLTVLVAFQSRDLRLGGASKLFAGLFAATMIFWLLIGYPQGDTGYHSAQYIPINPSNEALYAIGRFAKFSLFLAFFSFYPAKSATRIAQSAN